MSSDSEDDRRRRRRQDDSDSDSEEASPKHADPEESGDDDDEAAPGPAMDEEQEDMPDPETLEEFYAMLKRKRKGRKRIAGAEDGKAAVAIDIDEVNQSDRDYTYQEMLALVYNCIKGTGAKVRDEPFRLRPPQVVRDGSRKVVWVNFPDICKTLSRAEGHLFEFALAELGTTGSLNGDHSFVMRGRFTDKHLESLLRKYVQQYVACQMCRSLNTTISKDSHSRLTTLTCKQCFANRTVNNISTGFSAQIGRRKKKY